MCAVFCSKHYYEYFFFVVYVLGIFQMLYEFNPSVHSLQMFFMHYSAGTLHWRSMPNANVHAVMLCNWSHTFSPFELQRVLTSDWSHGIYSSRDWLRHSKQRWQHPGYILHMCQSNSCHDDEYECWRTGFMTYWDQHKCQDVLFNSL